MKSGEILEINTTVPSIVKRNCNSTSCNFNGSLETRHSSHVAFVTFRGNVELKKGSRIDVTGKYALSITSQNGHITIQTDINMTCIEENIGPICLGGFTQSRDLKVKIYKGEGINFHFFSFISTIFFASFNVALNSLYAILICSLNI